MDLKALRHLQTKIYEIPHANYPVHSRIHPLKDFCLRSDAACYVKRDDELGFGISGNKLRKFRTLIPHLIRKGCREAIILGGPYSNNVLSLTQLLLENSIEPTLFLRGEKPSTPEGNFLFLRMLLPENSLHWIPRKSWSEVDTFISAYTANRNDYFVIPEGAFLFPALAGTLTLPLDIVKNEEHLNISFDHLFIDVGTGFSAAALLLGFAFLKKQTICHLLLLAEEERAFLKVLNTMHRQFEELVGEKCPFPTHFTCSRSALAPSFGSTNRSLFEFIVKIARTQGFFLDPVYSGKLFHYAQKKIEEDNTLSGNALIIHSGGALSLSGFQDRLLSLDRS